MFPQQTYSPLFVIMFYLKITVQFLDIFCQICVCIFMTWIGLKLQSCYIEYSIFIDYTLYKHWSIFKSSMGIVFQFWEQSSILCWVSNSIEWSSTFSKWNVIPGVLQQTKLFALNVSKLHILDWVSIPHFWFLDYLEICTRTLYALTL